MNTRQLQYVLTVAQEKSFSKAAEKLHVSQPSLSQYVQRLEEELETELFDRSSIPLKLTYTGSLYCDTAKEFLSLEDQLVAQIKDAANSKRGRISIGISPYRTTYLLPPVLREFRRRYPDIEIELNEKRNQELEELLLSGDVDVAVTVLPLRNDQLVHQVLFNEKIVLAVPKEGFDRFIPAQTRGKPLASVDLELLKDAPFIALTSDYRLHDIMLNLCKEAGFTPNIILYCRNIEAVRAMVIEGLGVSILPYNPYIFLHSRIHPDYYTLEGLSDSREIAISFKKNRYLTNAAKAFVRILKDTLRDGNFGETV
ncbi:LysR family transcriptional regulator [Caproiciproducens faecalis]|uniref:LysR family transcriptional regulator n=1 Tax=Caproiciproducens faecalis TaxID=2820301 RepID=A0ABS7DN02_9FIRM|nr:LysR family transcriptional regulator [Caproiciproducens faecalis]MBW7572680.1 LysR family transcriptional regulator [Caproiciproducens faecalis]